MKKQLHILALLTVLLAAAATAFAQNAQLTGRVADQSGGAIVGATISVTNIGTRIQTTATTDDEGRYTLPPLAPGDYEIAVKASGFRPVVRSGVRLDVQQVARVDIALEAGQLTDSVNITAGAQLTEPETSSLGQVIENKRINELPLNGRNPIELACLTPNVNLQATAFNDSRNFNLVSMSINGGPPGTNAILLDGSSATLPERNEYSVSPNVDAVQEFKVQTNSYSAEFGLTGGGVINLVTKSGTNNFSGSLFEFARNDAFDANRWDFNRRNLNKAKLRYHQFGGAVGGTLWLPEKVFGPAVSDGRKRACRRQTSGAAISPRPLSPTRPTRAIFYPLCSTIRRRRNWSADGSRASLSPRPI